MTDDEGAGPMRRWQEAATLVDVADLTVEWLEGRFPDYPPYAGTPDPETTHLVETLVAMNRAGVVTTFSQPGEIAGDWRQRAAVEGFSSAGLAADPVGDGIVAIDPANGIAKLLQPDSTTATEAGEVGRLVGTTIERFGDRVGRRWYRREVRAALLRR